ncbi:RCC1/BLIP-II protein [Athelia psychrophila]|uniref:RCC1/BLIP-II protein n=1 Tax=Athelia psychrophila TaxID=1759441 RepID=A0A166JH59_9AGAM|nr:RCC1/BLIP-II protein [Fibularhizoctonia sp. CBS 109695]
MLVSRLPSKAILLQRLYSQSAPAAYGNFRSGPSGRPRTSHVSLASSAAVTAAALMWYSSSKPVHNDASPAELVEKARDDLAIGFDDGTLGGVVWGSNSYNVIAPQTPGVESVRAPASAAWLQNAALRDLALHEKHAACVDARGDVYQWGDGFFGNSPSTLDEQRKPALTLHGKDITHIALTENKVFALSSSGNVYVFAASAAGQASDAPATSAWYRPGWLLGHEQSIDFAEITPQHPLNRREKFVSISSGSDHLLALTSTGRAFAHPITKNANSHGQLGFRKFDIPAHSSSALASERTEVELIPKAVLDPYAKSTPYSRPAAAAVGDAPSGALQAYDDGNLRFSDTFFEIPGLKGIAMTQVLAAGRTSFAKTDSGRVLGWGANDYGQIGLGGHVTVDTVAVPTEVVLWRTVSSKLRSKCLDVYSGGNLTGFTVERVDEKGVRTVDLLMCGNGRWGGLGNNAFSSAQGSPLRAKSVSGLLEYSDTDNALRPLVPHALSISPTGHVLMTLDTQTHSGSGGGGRDLLVWGANQTYELGNGKRTSLAVPTNLEKRDGTRVMLMAKKTRVVDMQGKAWGTSDVEQCAAGGYGNTVVYWKIAQ